VDNAAIVEFPDNVRDVTVVALVASAGGLQPVTEILAALPASPDVAVLVLIHQQPDRGNALVHILQRATVQPVLEAEHDLALTGGRIYVAPPGKHLLVAPGPYLALIVSGAAPPSRPSADLMLSTLATACGPRAIAVVLSGGGHDGATGATAVHRFGGTVLATDEATSGTFSMPRATIERDHVIDHVLPLPEIAPMLVALLTGVEL
jgi:two-component system chemotaxis response regulator CheB